MNTRAQSRDRILIGLRSAWVALVVAVLVQVSR